MVAAVKLLASNFSVSSSGEVWFGALAKCYLIFSGEMFIVKVTLKLVSLVFYSPTVEVKVN